MTVLVATVVQVPAPVGDCWMRICTVRSERLPGGSFWMWHSPRGKVNSTPISSALVWVVRVSLVSTATARPSS